MAALWKATGQNHSNDSLIHAVCLFSLLWCWWMWSVVCLVCLTAGIASGAAVDHWWRVAGPVWRAVRRGKEVQLWYRPPSKDQHTANRYNISYPVCRDPGVSLYIFCDLKEYTLLLSAILCTPVTPPGFALALSDHLMLIYTGRTRLARNLLQVSQLIFSLCIF